MSLAGQGIGSPTFLGSEWPAVCVPLLAASGNVANAQARVTLPGVTGMTTYLAGFIISASGATLGLIVNPTITGLLGGVWTLVFGALAGVLSMCQPMICDFQRALPASAPNTDIVLTLPALGIGNTNASVCAWGYQL